MIKMDEKVNDFENKSKDIIYPSRLKNQGFAKGNKCFICHNILPFEESEICACCGEQFCSECISRKLLDTSNICPADDCNQNYKKSNLMKSKIVELKELEVKCKYQECNEYFQIQQLKLHEESCVFRCVNCEYCLKYFPQNLITIHKNICE